jgi:hypothetical protein
MPAELERPERLQIMLNAEELAAVDDFRFHTRMPSRAAAVRELMKRGLSAQGFTSASAGERSNSFGVLDASTPGPGRRDTAHNTGNGHSEDQEEG